MRTFLTTAGTWLAKNRRQAARWLVKNRRLIATVVATYWQPALYIGGLIIAAVGATGLVWALTQAYLPQLGPWPTILTAGALTHRAGVLANRIGSIS